ARTWVSILLLIFLFTGPYIKINGEPLLLLNVIDRKFVLFGNIFWPQDFHLFAIGMITFFVFIILFTVVYGRVFCGWVCPQTIFMEMLFRKIEYLIEGDWTQQKALDRKKGTTEYITKKGLKHGIFFIISFLIANTFLAYIIGGDELIKIVTDPPSAHIGGLLAILLFTAIFYGVFAKLREQVCTTICPYGRLQGVLLDRHSIVVAYDHERGEGRAKFKKGEIRKEVNKGDCIDCHQCVNVCPTGIDIRNGTQLECVNCTACIDACDAMMDNVGLPKGLIRYDSEASIAEKKKFKFTPRIIAYTVVLCILMFGMMGLMVSRTDVEASVQRTAGSTFTKQGDSEIINLYNYKIINKTNKELPIEIKLLNDDFGRINVISGNIIVEEQGLTQGALMIIANRDEISKFRTSLMIGIYSDGELIDKAKTTFIGPVKRTKNELGK
ncbi:MAG: cytochrome c oxidase accessory protein CcoG, partial [Bacteroidia bacterium]|nr:cytochrome c oxidase accessory protein CcoG [Bacteroidia bacterium]